MYRHISRRDVLPIILLQLALAVAGSSQVVKNAVPEMAHPLPLSSVRLTGGPLKHAQDLDAKYLLDLVPDRMLAYYRKRAGLEPKAPGYTGWDGDGRNLTGHIAGHYLSAVSLMYAATGDARFKERADYIVKELKEVQDKNGNGYAGALFEGQEHFNELAEGKIRSASFDLNGMWSPWYVLHKTFAGLRDAYRLTGNRTALDVETKFAAWAEGILSKLDEAQTQKMLGTEFGGMTETLADLYADTGDKRWLDLSHHFDHHAVIDPLSQKKDILGGLHGNTQVPKLLGTYVRYIYEGDPKDGTAGEFFWDAVALHHSFATGGHGKDEYFGPPDQLAERLDGRTAESCNVYNMQKFGRRLFAVHPDIKYADFEEKARFNHVLGSIDPNDGRTCYMVPVGRGVQHEYQNMQQGFTCCVGSGMENHGAHGDGIYYENGNKLWINLYAPSTADWKSAGVKLTMDTNFPDGDTATLTVSTQKAKNLTIAFRRPQWAGAGFAVKVNGKAIDDKSRPDSYVELNRKWNNGDTVSLVLPKAIHDEPTPDNPNRTALMWGPLVLAADLGPETRRPISTDPIPVFVSADRNVGSWIKPVADKPGVFKTVGVGKDITGKDRDLELIPFYKLHERMYEIYFDIYSPEAWSKKMREAADAEAQKKKIEAATLAFIQPGDAEKEKQFNLQGEETTVDRGRPARRAKKWFSYEMPVDPAGPVTLIVTYLSGEAAKRSFEILVDGERVGSQLIERAGPGMPAATMFDASYQIPAALLTGKQKVTVKFQGTNGAETAGVYGIRIIRGGGQ